jgi:E3 ubiquitin-protein ligase KEG
MIFRYGSDIICGVGQLHNAGILCMDIKPSTVLLDEKNRAHISSYGITSTEKDLSLVDTYAAPETWKCFNENEPPPFSKASDIWNVPVSINYLVL